MRYLVVVLVLVSFLVSFGGCSAVRGICKAPTEGHYYICGNSGFTGSGYVFEYKVLPDGSWEKVRRVY